MSLRCRIRQSVEEAREIPPQTTPAVRQTLAANGIAGGSGSATDGSSVVSGTQPLVGPEAAGETRDAPESGTLLAPESGDWDEVTSEEERFIRRYVETMTYMVHFSEAAAVEGTAPADWREGGVAAASARWRGGVAGAWGSREISGDRYNQA